MERIYFITVTIYLSFLHAEARETSKLQRNQTGGRDKLKTRKLVKPSLSIEINLRLHLRQHRSVVWGGWLNLQKRRMNSQCKKKQIPRVKNIYTCNLRIRFWDRNRWWNIAGLGKGHTARYRASRPALLGLKPSTGFPSIRDACSCFLTWEARDWMKHQVPWITQSRSQV